ncbi:MAG: hypothetical protein KF813_11900 [Trueperaceae bacterium]|nr:hypothetical protein [Trueperaceae bacterium]
MGHEVFSVQITKDGKVRVFWEGRCVLTLGGERAARLIAELDGASFEEQQYALQRVTGNFKRGNERLAGRGPQRR